MEVGYFAKQGTSSTLTFAADDRDTSCMTKVFRNESANGGGVFRKTRDSNIEP